MRWRRQLGAALVAAVVVCACARPSPEQQLRDTVAALQAAIEAGDAGAVRPLLAEDFIGPEGLDREGAVRMAQLRFLRHQKIGVTRVGPLRVELQSGHAQVGFDAALTGGSGRLLPDTARVYSVRTGWRLEHGDWRLTSAGWTPRL